MASALPQNTTRLPQTKQLEALYTIIRNQDTQRSDFIFYADRIIRLIVEEGLNYLPVLDHKVQTPTGETFNGVAFQGKICGVSILRAGESMETALRECCSGIRIGKILIQRDEETSKPKLFYAKLPPDIAERFVFLMDPMVATAGSALRAIEVLLEAGCKSENIIFLNVIASPQGLQELERRFPSIRVIAGCVDEGLDSRNYVIPGCGDFGDRYFSN